MGDFELVPNHANDELADWQDKIRLGDCLDILRQMPPETVDLVVTSPPYADSRKNTYGGIDPDKCEAFKRKY